MKYIDKIKSLPKKEDPIILAIESSCDETACAILKGGREVLSSEIISSASVHAIYGGVVPEIASRAHTDAIDKVVYKALNKANLTFSDLDAIAVTYGAGLLGALLVGVSYAKALAFSLGIPLIPVSHIRGHLAAAYLSDKELKPPFITLLASGGHTAIIHVLDYDNFEILGSTLDDAVGEAFDKVARVLNLPYPGGPEIDKLAKNGQHKYKFPVSNSLKGTLNFSFSGIKTAVVNTVHNLNQKGEEFDKADIACSFQESVTDELSTKAIAACKQTGINKLVIAGGVGANSRLYEKLSQKCKQNEVTLYRPVLKYCTDNAAMIGSAGYYMMKNGVGLADLTLTAKANVNL